MCKPLCLDEDESSNYTLQFLLKALAILEECKASGQSGLTAETFTACTLIPVGNGGNDLPPH